MVNLQRTTKGSKVIERLRKKLSEQESLLLLMSPNMAFRVANRNGKVSVQREDSNSNLVRIDWGSENPACGYSGAALCWSTFWHCSTRKEQDAWLFLFFQGFTFLISSDYERAEWREIIREQQKKCECLLMSVMFSILPTKRQWVLKYTFQRTTFSNVIARTRCYIWATRGRQNTAGWSA